MWDCFDNQEVGLEAAILERVRNSSLVEWLCADNVVGLKCTAEAAETMRCVWFGRGASCVRGSCRVTGGGGYASENAGMSSE